MKKISILFFLDYSLLASLIIEILRTLGLIIVDFIGHYYSIFSFLSTLLVVIMLA